MTTDDIDFAQQEQAIAAALAAHPVGLCNFPTQSNGTKILRMAARQRSSKPATGEPETNPPTTSK
jgi:hypothetical protein